MGLFTASNPVFDMLKEDHEKVKALFAQFEEARDSRTKERIVRETLRELEVHAKLEETLIYPAIRQKDRRQGYHGRSVGRAPALTRQTVRVRRTVDSWIGVCPERGRQCGAAPAAAGGDVCGAPFSARFTTCGYLKSNSRGWDEQKEKAQEARRHLHWGGYWELCRPGPNAFSGCDGSTADGTCAQDRSEN